MSGPQKRWGSAKICGTGCTSIQTVRGFGLVCIDTRAKLPVRSVHGICRTRVLSFTTKQGVPAVMELVSQLGRVAMDRVRSLTNGADTITTHVRRGLTTN